MIYYSYAKNYQDLMYNINRFLSLFPKPTFWEQNKTVIYINPRPARIGFFISSNLSVYNLTRPIWSNH